jgi:hypothetical protein
MSRSEDIADTTMKGWGTFRALFRALLFSKFSFSNRTIRIIKEIFLPYILSIMGYLFMALKVSYRLIFFD